MDSKIIVSGMRPTGKIHLGNFFGALNNWLTLQNSHKCYFFVADLHALTTASEKTEDLTKNTLDMVVTWLASGLDPEKCTIFVQSHVPEVSELNTLLGMITPLGWLLRNPTYKEQLVEIFKKKYAGQIGDDKTAAEKLAMLTEKELSEIASFGFLGYPVLMATDILIHKAAYVPVGQDQSAHLEISREIARRFNEQFHTDVLVEPKALFTKVPKVTGLDGRKMSKSYGNTIEVGEDVESLRKKIMTMFTDPNKKKATDPANPDGCTVFTFHKLYNKDFEKRCAECKAGALGCVACKKELFEYMRPSFEEFNRKKQEILEDKTYLNKILSEGAAKARESAAKTLSEVKKAIKLY